MSSFKVCQILCSDYETLKTKTGLGNFRGGGRIYGVPNPGLRTMADTLLILKKGKTHLKRWGASTLLFFSLKGGQGLLKFLKKGEEEFFLD